MHLVIAQKKIDSDSSKSGKDSTIIQSKVTVITERKKFQQNLLFHLRSMFFFAMKTSEAILQKTQDLSG